MLNLKNLSEKQALIYTVLGVIILCLIPTGILIALQKESGVGLFSGLFENPDNLTAKAEASQAAKKKTEAILAQEKGLNETLRGLIDEYERYKKALPEADNLEDIYKLIGDVAHESKLRTIDFRPIVHEKKIYAKRPVAVSTEPIDPSAPVVAAPPKEFPVNYVETVWKFEGSYQDILTFLHKVEDVDFERFVMVSELKLNPAIDPKKEDNLEYMTFDVTLVSFYYAKDLPPGAKK
jgi:Tfp pilus assembly protein PilO